MNMATLTLGPITFQEFEIPAKVRIPGGHKLGKNVNIGGKRITHAMGPDDGNITWSGILLGAGIQARASALQAVKDAGREVPFLCGSEFRMVIVEDLELNYQAFEIHYHISCYVTSNPARDATSGVGGALGLTGAIGVDVSAIAGIVGASPIVSAGMAALNTAGAALAAVPSLSAIALPALSAFVPPVRAAAGLLASEVASAGAIISAGPNTATSPQFAASLVGIGAAYDAQVTKGALINYGNRIVKNLVAAGAA
jgi:hypothetical protein